MVKWWSLGGMRGSGGRPMRMFLRTTLMERATHPEAVCGNKLALTGSRVSSRFPLPSDNLPRRRVTSVREVLPGSESCPRLFLPCEFAGSMFLSIVAVPPRRVPFRVIPQRLLASPLLPFLCRAVSHLARGVSS
jgi:hypothetical protein